MMTGVSALGVHHVVRTTHEHFYSLEYASSWRKVVAIQRARI